MVPAFQAPGQVAADISSTSQDDSAGWIAEGAQLFHHGSDIALGRQEKDRVIFLDDGTSVRNDGFVLPVDGCDACICVRRHVLTQGLQAVTDQWAAGIGLGGHQLGAPIGKIQHLQSPGVLNQPGDMFCHQPFRADQHINRAMFAVE